jgi:putative flippase GtrA
MVITMAEVTRICRYAAAGVLNTFVAYAVFALLLYVGIHYAAATLASGLSGMATSYFLSSRWVFGYRGQNRVPRFLALFAGLYIASLAVQRLLRDDGLFDGYTAGAIATVVTAIAGYVAGRSWVFASTDQALVGQGTVGESKPGSRR